MNCETCGHEMKWQGSLRTGHLECERCVWDNAVDAAVYSCEAKNEPVPELLKPNSAIYMVPRFKIVHAVGNDHVVIICPNCGIDFLAHQSHTDAFCPNCGCRGEIK